jgi:Putative zinc-finger
MTAEHRTDGLSDYLNGSLGLAEQRALEAHVAECDECRKVLDELRSVIAAAGELPDWGPERDLWPRIAAAIDDTGAAVIDLSRHLGDRGRGSERRRIRFTVPQLVAAGLALAIFSGATSLALARWGPHDNGILSMAPDAPAVLTVSDRAGELAPAYADELRRLEGLLAEHRTELAPGTVRILEKNLDIIDRSIEESLAALEEDSASEFLRAHLDRAFRRKVEYLREASAIAGWSL